MGMLKRLFRSYTQTREYEFGIGGTDSAAEKQLRKLLEEEAAEKEKNHELEGLAVKMAMDYEQQGFINGFRLAIGILKDC